MVTTMSHNSDFLNAIRKLSKAFSVHEKHAQYSVKNLTEAGALTRECITVLESYVDSIKEKFTRSDKRSVRLHRFFFIRIT